MNMAIAARIAKEHEQIGPQGRRRIQRTKIEE